VIAAMPMVGKSMIAFLPITKAAPAIGADRRSRYSRHK
jgi:hypothetical protein